MGAGSLFIEVSFLPPRRFLVCSDQDSPDPVINYEVFHHSDEDTPLSKYSYS